MAIEYNFTLDMDRSKRDNNIAYARTGDVDSITINADLVLNGAAYTPTGTNAFFECITPNGHSIRVAASKTGSAVSVDVPSAAFQAAGVINVAYFRFETGSSDNPTYVESTEPFAIVVREGIGDVIDTGDYIEEWRKLADQLEAIVAEVEQKADQAETAINEQKTEVDQLKAQVQVSMAQDAEDVSDAKDTAISNINGSQGAVDAAIDQLEKKTQEAVDAAQEALDGTLAADLQNAIDRTLKLAVADMVNISNNTSLSSLTAVGSYCCKTASAAATIKDSPVDDSPFNMYVFSSATSGQVMQLVVPIDLNGKPVAEWHVRFGTSSAMDPWSVIGGGADIAAGLGIDVTGDAKKTVALDTDAFYQHHEVTDIIQGSTEVTGGGRIKELKVYGNTRQNLWVNPSGKAYGVTVTANANGSVTLSGTSTQICNFEVRVYNIRPGTTYTLSIDKPVPGLTTGYGFYFDTVNTGAKYVGNSRYPTENTFVAPEDATVTTLGFYILAGVTVSGTYRVMLNEGSEPQPWCPPGLNGVEELSIVTAGKNLLSPDVSRYFMHTGVSVEFDGDDIVVTANNVNAYSCAGLYLTEAVRGRTISFGKSSIEKVDGETYPIMQLNYTVGGTNYYQSNSEKSYYIPTDASSVIITFYANNSDKNGVSGTVRFKSPFVCVGETGEFAPFVDFETTPIDMQGHALNSFPDGTRDELRIDGTGAVTLVQRVGVTVAPSGASAWYFASRLAYYVLDDNSITIDIWNRSNNMRCDRLVPAYSQTADNIMTTNGARGYARSSSLAPDAPTAAANLAGMTTLYPLAVPKEVELPGVSMPDLASPSYAIFASSNIPAEIEAEVVKVDYLPPTDVYTKQEVDQKIEDASMPDIVPVSQGGTGVTTAAAERNRLGLGNTTGALPVANGGTGATTAKAVQYNLLSNIDVVDGGSDDSSLFAFAYASPSSATGALYKRTGLNVWNWIVSKIRSTFGFSSSNVLPVSNGGTGGTSAKAAQNSLLNDMNVSSDPLTDSSMLVGYNASPSASNGAVHKRSMTTIWDYVASKIRSTFGFNSSNVLQMSRGGTGATSAASARTNLDVYSKTEVDGKVPKVVYGTGNIPSSAENGTIYIQYRS